MPDFAQPSDVIWSNPYLAPAPQPDKLSVLSNILLGLGAGMSNAAANGRSEWAGLGPGAAMGMQMNAHAQQQAEMEQMKKQQAALQWMAFQDKRAERERQLAALKAFPALLGGGGDTPAGVPGAPQAAVPGTFAGRVAGYEGGAKNGGMIFNELGSGAFGPYQFMPGTWGDVRNSNPDLNLPADMTQATRAQHDAAFQRFSQGNANALTKAGFKADPVNLYLAHRFGAGGATALLNAKDDALLADVLPREWQAQNPDMRGQTVGGFKRLAAERMGGLGGVQMGVPYQANGETTQYMLKPDSLPGFMGIPGSPIIPVGGNPTPGLTMQTATTPLPPTPLPQMPAIPAAPQGQPAAAPATLEPPKPPVVPKPMLPASEAARINRAVELGVITQAQGLAERDKVINDIWSVQKEQAARQYEQAMKLFELQYGDQRKIAEEERAAKRKLEDEARAAQREGTWVRDPATNQERWVPNADLKPGMVRGDKPKEVDPGSEAADWATLARGQADREFAKTPEYAAAYTRRAQRPITVGGGATVSPDMRYFPPPAAEVVNPEGAPAVTGEKAYTESQGRDYTYARRLENSIPQLEKMLLGADGKYSTARLPSAKERLQADSAYYPDSWLSPQAKEFRRLAKDIVTAILRRESGASIPTAEYAPEYAKYIPQPNDSHEEILAKLRAAKIAARSIAEGSGRPLKEFGTAFNYEGAADSSGGSPIRINTDGTRK